jgi:signal transduction histidine kinase
VTRGSLRVRLLGLAAVTITIALAIAWLALTILFERHVIRRVDAELANQVLQIAANLDPIGEQLVLRREPTDPRFERPFGGLYWQVEAPGSETLRSRSLWDVDLPLPPDTPATPVSYEATLPQGDLVVRAEALTIPSETGARSVRVLIAADRGETQRAVAAYRRDLGLALAIIGLCLTAAAALQVGVGLSPLATLREQLAAVRARRARRLDATVPSEVSPLVEEVNQLLSAQDEALSRARARASDLAHGLKTPLTVLAAVAHTLNRGEDRAQSEEIIAQVDMMRRRIDRHLARARLGMDQLATTRLDLLVDRLVDVMTRLPGCERLKWSIEIPPDAIVAADDIDLAEAVGNVLENACKWARETVGVTASVEQHAVRLVVEDDGPGVPDDQLSEILARGKRLSEDAEGAGLGLAIVFDIVDAYGGEITLSRSSLGGLRVALVWTRAKVMLAG